MRKTVFRHRYCAALCCAAAGFAQMPTAALRSGNPAPPIIVDQLLQAPEGARASLSDLKGKVVVLEFWGTWCGPCVAAIPHLNSLVSAYQSKPVQFLFLTDEEQWRVEAFLKLRPITGWIGLDPTRATFDAYGAEALPKTVLLDGNGMVAAVRPE
jgi:thiol-disulfide isomerase/thioredoxin